VQKGFNKERQIHEVIINASENIEHCKKKNIAGAMICVDQMKAFDSVDHSFMLKCLRFFNFGEYFINGVVTLGMNRKACVLLDNGEKTNFFDLLRGTAQGDCPSPILYNICAQILIFKIELDDNIPSIYERTENEVFDPGGTDLYRYEYNGATNKNESFADDSTTFTLLNFEALSYFKATLEAFSKLSGLRCNLEKTVIMRIGDTESEMDPRINSLGFTISKSCCLLGFDFAENTDLAVLNFAKVDKKINGILNFWRPFFLSTSGKITIVKTLIYPVINYHATVLCPDNTWVEKTTKKIESYIGNGWNIGHKRIWLDVEDGGLGLASIYDIVTGLQCAWVRRALLHDHDNWSSKLTKLNKDFELTLTERDITNFGPVLGGILRNFLKFRDSLIEYKNNYVHVPILNNKKFIVKRGEAGIFDDNFFETFAPGIDVNTRSTLTWHKCTDGNKEFLGREALNDNIGTRLDFRSYVRLKSGYANAKRKFDDGKVGAKRKLKDFIIMNKNGAKGFRVVFKETKT
jgi:hypothetical protein